ncbi:hypothetical protein WwAna0172, partial [Wolbachia endosymbiont of Drosophila ananassae]
PEAVEKRAERARRKEERDRKDEVYNLSLYLKNQKIQKSTLRHFLK